MLTQNPDKSRKDLTSERTWIASSRRRVQSWRSFAGRGWKMGTMLQVAPVNARDGPK